TYRNAASAGLLSSIRRIRGVTSLTAVTLNGQAAGPGSVIDPSGARMVWSAISLCFYPNSPIITDGDEANGDHRQVQNRRAAGYLALDRSRTTAPAIATIHTGGHGDHERAKGVAGRMRLPVECHKDHDRPIKQKREANQYT